MLRGRLSSEMLIGEDVGLASLRRWLHAFEPQMITYQTEVLLRGSEGVDLLRDNSWSTSVGGCPSNIYLQASGTQDGRSFFITRQEPSLLISCSLRFLSLPNQGQCNKFSIPLPPVGHIDTIQLTSYCVQTLSRLLPRFYQSQQGT